MCSKHVFFVATLFVYAIQCAPAKFRMNPSCKPSKCIEIRKCPYFVDLLERTGPPLPRNVTRDIKKHQCGFTKKKQCKFMCDIPMVCCPTRSPPSNAKAMVPRITQPPDVTGHKNLWLLPQDICGEVYSGFRITSGSKTDVMEFPWMALLAYSTSNGIDFKCGGTVINERYVLTAAHCVVNSTVVGVRLGEHNIRTEDDCDEDTQVCAPPFRDFYVEDVIVHPNYSQRKFLNDIALIRLARSANFAYDNIKPICLPVGESAKNTLDGKYATVTGWGVTTDGNKSETLLKISVPVVPNEICKKINFRYSSITPKQLCAGGYMGRDSCGGDSGGPLKYIGHIGHSTRYIQYGIVSYGPRHCGAEGQPGVYTRVSFYMPWILDNLKPPND